MCFGRVVGRMFGHVLRHAFQHVFRHLFIHPFLTMCLAVCLDMRLGMFVRHVRSLVHKHVFLALYRHRRRHLHCADTGVPVLKMTAWELRSF